MSVGVGNRGLGLKPLPTPRSGKVPWMAGAGTDVVRGCGTVTADLPAERREVGESQQQDTPRDQGEQKELLTWRSHGGMEPVVSGTG